MQRSTPPPHPPSINPQATSLRSLSLAHNGLLDVPDALGGCAALTTLDLSHNALRQLPGTFDTLPRLTHLDASFNALRFLPATLKRCKELVSLNVEHNAIGVRVAVLWGGDADGQHVSFRCHAPPPLSANLINSLPPAGDRSGAVPPLLVAAAAAFGPQRADSAAVHHRLLRAPAGAGPVQQPAGGRSHGDWGVSLAAHPQPASQQTGRAAG
jgi:hypothetical protein